MIFLIITLCLAVIILLARHLYIKHEILNVTKQLEEINKNKWDNKVTVGLLDKDFEKLGRAINEIIDLRKQCEAGKLRSERALKNAIADMSHDLRTPLTSVIGYLQFMKKVSSTAEEKAQYLDIAYERAKVLEEFLNDFYTLSLIDSAEYEINLERLDLSRALKEALVDRHNEFLERKLEMTFQIPDKSLYVIGDKQSLHRVIGNLLNNTLKYTKNRVVISLNTEKDLVTLEISNDAADLKTENLERFFDRFYRADNSRSEKGAGLGLAISKALMEKMGGDIEISMVSNMLNICCKFKKYRKI
ncbi:MAG: HAMP domain-containing histidine kinase [Clostridiales bacterium]|mgnify:CR=1 FL=1|nr:HAMP domain-containing histidine kinase [Clostridiales bacterium]